MSINNTYIHSCNLEWNKNEENINSVYNNIQIEQQERVKKIFHQVTPPIMNSSSLESLQPPNKIPHLNADLLDYETSEETEEEIEKNRIMNSSSLESLQPPNEIPHLNANSLEFKTSKEITENRMQINYLLDNFVDSTSTASNTLSSYWIMNNVGDSKEKEKDSNKIGFGDLLDDSVANPPTADNTIPPPLIVNNSDNPAPFVINPTFLSQLSAEARKALQQLDFLYRWTSNSLTRDNRVPCSHSLLNNLARNRGWSLLEPLSELKIMVIYSLYLLLPEDDRSKIYPKMDLVSKCVSKERLAAFELKKKNHQKTDLVSKEGFSSFKLKRKRNN